MPSSISLPGRVSTVDALVADLRSRILGGEFTPGDRLAEVELAGHYDVGRYSLRAAFRELVHEGLLVHRANRGVSVPIVDRDEADDQWSYRRALELAAVRLAFERRAIYDDAAAALADLDAMSADAPWEVVAELHVAFHAGIVDAAGSRRLSAAYDALRGELLYFTHHIRPSFTVDGIVAMHRSLLDALGSPSLAEREAAISADLEQGRQAINTRAD